MYTRSQGRLNETGRPVRASPRAYPAFRSTKWTAFVSHCTSNSRILIKAAAPRTICFSSCRPIPFLSLSTLSHWTGHGRRALTRVLRAYNTLVLSHDEHILDLYRRLPAPLSSNLSNLIGRREGTNHRGTISFVVARVLRKRERKIERGREESARERKKLISPL